MDIPVEIVVTGRNIDVSDQWRSRVAARITALDHLGHNISRYDVELSHERNPRQSKSSERVVIAGHGKGPTVRAEAHGNDLRTVLDAAIGKLEGQLHRSHDRYRVHHYRRPHTTAEPGQN